MKKTLRLVGVAAMVLLLAASCKKEEKNNGEKQMMTFSAGIEQTGAKTGLLPNGSHAFKQVWTEGDAISVNGTSLTVSINPEDNAKGTFTGEVLATGKYYAVYPATAALSNSTATFTLPESQDYVVDSYDSDLAPMTAYTENNELNFTNLCGLMELSLVGDGITVTSLKLSCDKPICGQTKEYTIGGVADLEMAESAGTPITMNCGDGVVLEGNAKSFIFVLPPVENGAFSLTVSYTAGANAIQMTKSLGNITIEAGKVAFNNNPYSIEAGSSAPEGFVDLGTHVGGVSTGKPLYWAKCNLGATNPQDYGGYYPWGDITARTYSTWDTYIYGAGDPFVTKYCRTGDAAVWRGSGSPDNILELDNSDDAAYSKTDDGIRRMPTKEEYDELKQKAYFVWTSNYNDINIKGCIIYKSVDPTQDHGFTKASDHEYSTAVGGDEHIFIPAGGRLMGTIYDGQGKYVKIWTKTLLRVVRPNDPTAGRPSSSGIAIGLKGEEPWFIPGNYQVPDDYYQGRYYGMNLRPVFERK